MTWTSTTDKFVRVNGVWLRAGAVNAVQKTTAGKARVYLAGGTTVDVPLDGKQTPDTIVDAITKEPRP